MKKIKFIVPILGVIATASALAPAMASCSNNKTVKVSINGEATCDLNEIDTTKVNYLTLTAKENKMLLNNIVVKHGNQVLSSDLYFIAQGADKTSLGISINANVVKGDLTIEVKSIDKINIYSTFTEKQMEQDLLVVKGFSNDFLNLDKDTAAALIGKRLVIPANAVIIETNAFYDENRDCSTIPSTVEYLTFGDIEEESQLHYIKTNAFKYAPFVYAFCPDSTGAISKHAFYGCESLIGIDLGQDLDMVGEEAFCNCKNLLSVSLPHRAWNIGRNAFRKCHNLCKIQIDVSLADNAATTGFKDNVFDQISDYGGLLIVKDAATAKILMDKYPDLVGFDVEINPIVSKSFKTTKPIEQPEKLFVNGFTDEFLKLEMENQMKILGTFRGLAIPGVATNIGDNAFYDSQNDKSTMPSWLTELSIDSYIEDDGTYEFNLSSIGDSAFRKAPITKLELPETVFPIAKEYQEKNETLLNGIGNNAFKDCTNLSSISFPDILTDEVPDLKDNRPESFVNVAEKGTIYFDFKKIMRLGYDVEKMKTAWTDYFTKASFNKQTSTSSMIFDDNHWTFADISEQK